MSNIPGREYAERRTKQLVAALNAANGPLAVSIIKLIAADGYPEFADALTRELVEQGLNRLADVR